jgi:hypothetical protein
MSNPSTYRLNGPANPNFSRVARLALSAIASEVDANVEEIDDVRLVVSELINIALDSKAETIDLAITPGSKSIYFELRGNEIENEITNDLSIRIFEALVKDLEVAFNPKELFISGKMVFAE